jgi:hypothetical protein
MDEGEEAAQRARHARLLHSPMSRTIDTGLGFSFLQPC